MTTASRRALRILVAILLTVWLLVFFPKFVLPVFVNLFLGLGVELPLPAGWFLEYPQLTMWILTVGPIVVLGCCSSRWSD